jgi:hypothetical protein
MTSLQRAKSQKTNIGISTDVNLNPLALSCSRVRLVHGRVIWANQPIHSFLEGKGLGNQQGTSVRVGSPQPW